MRRFGFSPGYRATGVRFDGSNDWLAITSGGLTGAADSKLLTCSYWIRKQGSDGVPEIVFASATDNTGAGGTARVNFIKNNVNRAVFSATDVSGNLDLVFRTAAEAVLVAGGWKHVMMSVDMSDTAKRHIYVSDVSNAEATAYNNDTLEMTVPVWVVGAAPGGASKLNADIADLWFKPGVYVDLSVAANRRKFINESGRPVDLGVDGTAPGLGAPLVYLSRRSETAADFATNRGTGGNFTVNGALANSATSPSD